MSHQMNIELATLPQIAEELSSRANAEFIFIYRDHRCDEWVIDLNEDLDGLKVVELFNAFQARMLQIISDQQACI